MRKWRGVVYHRKLVGVILAVFFVVVGVSLCSHNPYDTSWFYYASSGSPIMNACGFLGAQVSALLLYLFGAASLFIVGAGIFFSYLLLSDRSFAYEWDRFIGIALAVWTMATLSTLYGVDFLGSTFPGGQAGYAGMLLVHRWCNPLGGYLTLHVLLCMSVIIAFRFSFVTIVQYGLHGVRYIFSRPVFLVPLQQVAHHARSSIFFFNTAVQERWHTWCHPSSDHDVWQSGELISEEFQQLRSMMEVHVSDVQEKGTILPSMYDISENNCSQGTQEEMCDLGLNDDVSSACEQKPYQTPPLTIFSSVDDTRTTKVTRELEMRARALEQKLAHFGVTGKVTEIRHGPVVTLFEYKPDITAKISKIVSLEDDLALALQALSIRIIAPIPGRAVIGFEVANKQRQGVALASLMHAPEYEVFTGALPLVLGEDTIGGHVVIDLARMPHLLIAGSTGSGKSVALNVMLLSLLCKRNPEQLRLIVIDPKRLEFSAYADIAHLLFPIITDAKRAIAVLTWVVQEMNRRYEKMAERGVRVLSDYNIIAEQTMPNLVVVIDELADLMMTGGRDIEDLIVRIAQMARAAGIHLIVATQRPSVDVVTGLIKVNFPSRISFRVSSKIDSRTILDCAGAEKLLGRGDMLFLDAAQIGLQRIHGAYVTDQEIQAVVNHIKAQRKPDYLDLESELRAMRQASSAPEDDLYEEVLHFLQQVDEVSISLLQRKFRIGYNRSARIIEMLESQGLVLQSDGGKIRKVIH